MQLKPSKKQKWEATDALGGSGDVVPPALGEPCLAAMGGSGVGGVEDSSLVVETITVDK